MAKLEKELSGSFDDILRRVEDGVLHGSMTATLEESADYREDGARCAVRVFERYSALGKNRVSMSVTLFQCGGRVRLCAITSGGSQAVFFKFNTFGEQSFLDTLQKIL